MRPTGQRQDHDASRSHRQHTRHRLQTRGAEFSSQTTPDLILKTLAQYCEVVDAPSGPVMRPAEKQGMGVKGCAAAGKAVGEAGWCVL